MARKAVQQGHIIVTDESKLPNEEIKEDSESLQEVEGIQLNENITKGVTVFTLKGASSFLCRGIKFEQNVPVAVTDKTLAARLSATGFFKEGV